MRDLLSRAYVIGYLFYIAPPRAIEIFRNHQLHNGELRGWSPSFIIIFEGALRTMLLLLIAVGIEVILGAFWYEVLRLDLVFGTILCSGILHTLVYMYFYLYSGYPNTKSNYFYRFGRNFCYAILPGLALMVLLRFIDEVSFEISLPTRVFLNAYVGMFVGSLIAGIIEAISVTRRPLGLFEEFETEKD